MGLFDKLRGELVDIVEWIDDPGSILLWRFPRYHNQIKHGAQLIVRPGQAAVFVHRGKLADVFEPGNYELKTDNLPILSTLQGWKHGFDSPFKAEIYFVSTRQVTDLKWGTPHPIMLRDPDYGPIRLRAFGHYTLKAVNPATLLKELVGTDSSFEASEVTELIRSIINTSFADLIGKSKIAALDLAANYQDLSSQLREKVIGRIDDEYGLDIPQLFIVNISLPEEVEKALDLKTQMSVIGDMSRYQQYQMGQAMTAAASNPSGGGAAEGMGLGMGFAMAGQMMRGVGQAGGAAGMVPPPPPGGVWHITTDGQTRGPFSEAQMAAGIGRSEINAETLVWTAGMTEWALAGTVQPLAGHFDAPPPAPSS